jgi:hypothetical protein
MEYKIYEIIDGYLGLLQAIEMRTHDRQMAVLLLPEIAKDLRMGQMRETRNLNGDTPATENQIGYLKRLGAVIPAGITRQQASELIDRKKAEKEAPIQTIKIPVRVP